MTTNTMRAKEMKHASSWARNVSSKPTKPGTRWVWGVTFSLLLRASFLINLDLFSFFFSFDGTMRPLNNKEKTKTQKWIEIYKNLQVYSW